MNSYLEILAKQREIIENIKTVVDIFGCRDSSIDWHAKAVEGYISGLFDRFAPWKEGDRVMLIKTPVINKEEAWGWMCAKHILVAGRRGTVSEIDFYNGKFVCLFCPDDQTWIKKWGEDEGTEYPVDRPSHYSFSEDWLVRVDEQWQTRR